MRHAPCWLSFGKGLYCYHRFVTATGTNQGGVFHSCRVISYRSRDLPQLPNAAARLCRCRTITVHYKAYPNLHRTVQYIKELGCRASVAVNPHTAVLLLDDIVADLDMVLIMSVNPGFGGQKFIHNTYKKLTDIRALASEKNPGLYIEVDGGVDATNAAQLVEAGANVLVAGNSVFSAADQKGAIAGMKRLGA